MSQPPAALVPGQLAPWFHAPAVGGNPRFAFDTAAGRWIVLLLLGPATGEAAAAALALLAERRALFDDATLAFFGVATDPADAETGRIAQQLPGIRWFMDADRAVSRGYGAASAEGDGYAPHWLLLDPMLRVRRTAALADGAGLLTEAAALAAAPSDIPAPVLVVPEVFPRALCRRLIALYEDQGGEDSGFMVEADGVTTRRSDHRHKRRADCVIADATLVAELKARLATSLRPLIRRAFQFDASRIERFIVACYDAADGGHFARHRDNTTAGTAHRRFACTINLNAEDYDGGDLSFPEFGARTYRAPTGGAVIFSCSLLHEARPVTRGRRFAFLPFLYDDAAAQLREANMARVAPELQGYRAGPPQASR